MFTLRGLSLGLVKRACLILELLAALPRSGVLFQQIQSENYSTGPKGATQMKRSQIYVALSLPVVLLAALASALSAQNPLAALENAAKQKAAEAAIETLLNNQLPLTLNAKDVYPTVNQLPGGPFSPTPLQLTADQLDQPIAPGDYTINTLDFCSEYSVHEPGAGVAYVLGPYEGKAAGAIGALIWRGTVQYHINPNTLQAVSWTIQSGLTYSQMPKSYQAIVDQVIPDFKSEFTSDFIVNLETTYNNAARAAQLPPLDAMLAKMGAPGQLALDAERQRAILTRQNTSDQIREQTLFQGQESGLYTPVKAETGPWTERVKNQVYMKLLIAGGNMNTNNVMQIRILPSPNQNASAAGTLPYLAPHLVRAAYGEPQITPALADAAVTITGIMQGTIGYSQGRGAQALGQVPVVFQNPAPAPSSTPIGVAQTATQGPVTVIHAGTTTPVPLEPGDTIGINDTIQTGPGAKASILFDDNTEFTLGENSKLKVDDYVYDPDGNSNRASYRFLEGVFQYVGGLIEKNNPAGVHIDTPVDGVGIRGTEFIAKVNPAGNSLEVDLISGAVALTPNGSTAAGPTTSAPAQIKVSPQGTKVLPLTQGQYDTIESQMTPAAPIS
jgi:FecR-like protein